MHILLPVTDNCSSWISRRGRMAVEMFSWPSLHERMCRIELGGPLAYQANTVWNQLLLELSLDLFSTLKMWCRHIEDMHEEVWCRKNIFWQTICRGYQVSCTYCQVWILIESSSKLLVTRTCIKARSSLILGRIRPLILGLLALEWRKFHTLANRLQRYKSW